MLQEELVFHLVSRFQLSHYFPGCPKDRFIVKQGTGTPYFFLCFCSPHESVEEARGWGSNAKFLCFFLRCSPKFATSKSSHWSQWTKHSGYFLMTHLWPPEPLNGHYQTLLDQDRELDSHNNINSAPESGVLEAALSPILCSQPI